MSKLEAILAPYEVLGELGGKAFDREYLRSTLAAASRQAAIAFWLAVISQLALFLLGIWLAVRNAGDPKLLSLILAGGGGGLGAACFAMTHLWKEKVSTDLTLALIGSLDSAAALSALNVVLESLRRDRKSPRSVIKQRTR